MFRTNGEEEDEMIGPAEILWVPRPLPPLPETFSPKLSCCNRLPETLALRCLNVPLFIATDAPAGLGGPLLAPLINTFPCTFILGSFKVERAYLEGLRDGYNGVHFGRYLNLIVDALVMGGALAVVGTEGSTFGSTFGRYVEDTLWRSHG